MTNDFTVEQSEKMAGLTWFQGFFMKMEGSIGYILSIDKTETDQSEKELKQEIESVLK